MNEIALLRMPGRIMRLGLAITLGVILTNLPVLLAGPVLWVLGSLYVSLTEIIVEELREVHQALRCLEAGRDAHAGVLAERDARIEILETDLAAARFSARRIVEQDGNPVYRRVGLSPSAPDWLVQAARTAYRRRLHPDVHPAHHRQQAHDRYIRAEEAFERIGRLRSR